MPTWTPQQVEALAPDASSAKSGRELANPRKWKTLGRGEQAAWGECQGSGKDPYQTQVELSEPAFRCSCPSRKFPCKHGLGLLLILAAQPQSVPEGEPPGWVAEWLESRSKRAEQRAEQQAKKGERAGQPRPEGTRPAAQARRVEQRLGRVRAGLDYVETWLGDLVRSGLTSLPGQPYRFWETPAARMVDAQAPGVGRLIREMAGIPATGDGWQERLLERLGRLHLLIEGFRRLDSLPDGTQAGIRSLIGWTMTQEELLSGAAPAVSDRWLVAGQRVEDEEKLRTQRTWLWGQQGNRPALVLHFAAPGQPLDRTLVPGACVEGELVYFPGAHPLRAVFRSRGEATMEPAPSAGCASAEEAVAAYAGTLAANPWLERFPFVLRGVVPARRGETWQIQDAGAHVLPLAPAFSHGWHLLALSGGYPVTLAGEWDGDWLIPLSVWAGGGFYPLT